MSSSGDKDKKLVADELIAGWPLADRDADAWEEFAVRVQGAVAAAQPADTVRDDLFAPPFPAEPGEGTVGSAVRTAGGSPMSDESDKPRPSLKDIAKRVSVPPPGAPVPSQPPTGAPSTPPQSGPGAARSSMPSVPGIGRPSAAVSKRAAEASDSDSGMVDLNVVRQQASSLPDTGKQPGTEGLFDEDQDKPKAAAAAAPKAAPKKSSSAPLIVGSFVALAAIAAVAVLSLKSRPDAAPESAPVAMASAPAAQESPAAGAAATASAAEPVASAAPADSNAPSAPVPGALAKAEEKTAGGAKETATKTADKDKAAAAAPTATGLEGAMATAVGATPAAPPAETSTPSGPAKNSADVPEVPSQGAIQGAMGAVMGAARACVAGMDEPSRAQVTFSNSGAVSNVSVSGAASGKTAAGCIVAALKRAKVGPFQKPTYSVGVTIRP